MAAAVDMLDIGNRYREIFSEVPVSIWEEDWTDVIATVRRIPADTEDGFRRYLAEHPEVVAEALRQVRVVDVNDYTCRMFHATSKQQLLDSLESVFATDDTLPGFVGELVALFRGDTVHRTEMALRTVPGDLIHVLLTMTFPPRGSASGAVLVSLMDISDRVSAEEALRESELRFRSTFEQAAVGIAHVSPDGRFRRINRRFCEIAGRSRAEMLAASFQEITHPDDLDTDLHHVEKLLAGETSTYSMVKRYLRKDGSEVWVNLTVSLVRDAAGEPEYFIAVVEDVSERKQRERERDALLAELEDRTRDLEQVLYVTSHDLRTPLVNIQGFGQELAASLHELEEIVCAGGPASDAGRVRLAQILETDVPEALGYIQSSVARMDALLQALLRLSRAGRTKPRMEPLDLGPVLERVLGANRFELERCGIEVRMGALPRCLGDGEQLGQVFANLVGNAAKFLDPERPGHIEISGARQGDQVVYEVRDNGIGIAPPHQPRIFDLFHRLDPGGPPGDGLGLAIVDKIVRLHGGRVHVESTPGEGSRFFVTLPATRDGGAA